MASKCEQSKRNAEIRVYSLITYQNWGRSRDSGDLWLVEMDLERDCSFPDELQRLFRTQIHRSMLFVANPLLLFFPLSWFFFPLLRSQGAKNWSSRSSIACSRGFSNLAVIDVTSWGQMDLDADRSFEHSLRIYKNKDTETRGETNWLRIVIFLCFSFFIIIFLLPC